MVNTETMERNYHTVHKKSSEFIAGQTKSKVYCKLILFSTNVLMSNNNNTQKDNEAKWLGLISGIRQYYGRSEQAYIAFEQV